MNPTDAIGRRERAWRAAAVLSALWFVVGLLRFRRELSLVHSPALQALRIGHSLLAAGALSVLLARRRTMSATACILVVVVVTLTGLFPVWVAQTVLAKAGEHAALFLGPAFAMLAIATLAPEPSWVGLALIGALALESTVLAHMVNEPGEPSTVLLFSAVTVLLHLYRMKHLHNDIRLAALEAERVTLGRLARVLLAMRDLSNTPLQVLVLELELIKQRGGVDDLVIQRMETAVGSLRELRGIVKELEEQIPFEYGDPAIDSIDLLNSEVRRLRGR